MENILNFILMCVEKLLMYKGIKIDKKEILESASSALTGPPFFLDAVDMFQLCDVIESRYHVLIPEKELIGDQILTISKLNEQISVLLRR